MARFRPSMKRTAEWLAAAVIFAAVVVLYNGWFWVAEGDPRIPQLEGRWWAGYVDTTLFGRQWTVVRFIEPGSGRIQMVMLSSFGAPDYYEVERSSSNRNFVYLTMTDNSVSPPLVIEAKQAYEGKRYFWGRLINGRFSDFWKMNDDVRILGNVVSWDPPKAFAIEPIDGERLTEFWVNFVRPGEPTPTPGEILEAEGIELSR